MHEAGTRKRFVMPGLDPAVHAFVGRRKNVDARVKPGHDELRA